MQHTIMTISESLKNLKHKLLSIYDEGEAHSMAQWVLCSVTKQNWNKINTTNCTTLSDSELIKIKNILAELLQHKPIQYILGESYFYNMQLFVNENVLIPRPETEELIDYIDKHKLKLLPNLTGNVLDIGTGSGCIAISLKKILHNAQVTALDISNSALEVAQINARNQNVAITLQQEDILAPSRDTTTYHLIVSNPPYITIEEKNTMLPNVLEYEPHTALFVTDGDPLQFYKAILQKANTNLCAKGYVLLELNPMYADATQVYFQNHNYATQIIRDMQGKKRFLQAQKLFTP